MKVSWDNMSTMRTLKSLEVWQAHSLIQNLSEIWEAWSLFNITVIEETLNWRLKIQWSQIPQWDSFQNSRCWKLTYTHLIPYSNTVPSIVTLMLSSYKCNILYAKIPDGAQQIIPTSHRCVIICALALSTRWLEISHTIKQKRTEQRHLKGGSTSQSFDHYKRHMLQTAVQNTLS